jgi:hypothetical protein
MVWSSIKNINIFSKNLENFCYKEFQSLNKAAG